MGQALVYRGLSYCVFMPEIDAIEWWYAVVHVGVRVRVREGC